MAVPSTVSPSAGTAAETISTETAAARSATIADLTIMLFIRRLRQAASMPQSAEGLLSAMAKI
jgi:hypothetical protein